MVNGKNVGSPYYEIPADAADVDIEVAFKPVTVSAYVNPTISVGSIYGGPIGSNPVGKTMRLLSAYGVFDAMVDDNGKATFANVPVGKYTVSFEGIS